jgi:hypothetical protein
MAAIAQRQGAKPAVAKIAICGSIDVFDSRCAKSYVCIAWRDTDSDQRK